jgi:hypothetical protein
LSIEQIQQLADSLELCNLVANHPEGIPYTDELNLLAGVKSHGHVDAIKMNRRAKILFLVNVLNLAEEKGVSFLSSDLFDKVIGLEGLQSQPFKDAYRFDSRTPADIQQLNGFFPKKRLGTIYEHSDPNSQGVAFVSLSTTEGNKFNLAIQSVRKASKISNLSVLSQADLFILKSRGFKGSPLVLETNEYHIKNVQAVRPHIASIIKEEDEVIAPFVSVDQVLRYRKVVFVIDDQGEKESHLPMYVSYGPWVAFAE